MQIYCSTCSVIFNVTATQYTCSLKCLLPPLTSTVKSSLFTHAHSSPLSLAARLHQCCTNCSHYINNGQTFSRQTSYCVQYTSYELSLEILPTKISIVMDRKTAKYCQQDYIGKICEKNCKYSCKGKELWNQFKSVVNIA